ncbi:MAG: hypothetical protein H0X73_05395 [Chthoniobacterales bacterium]|nr:hypothetical protein [Chthoniobacterales bacterium]
MKKYLLAAVVIAASAVGTAQAQEFSAPADRAPRVRTEKPVTPLPPRAPVGAVPRATRGNPIQMLNPRAPAKYYGTPDETVTYDPNNPTRITGIILFGLRF